MLADSVRSFALALCALSLLAGCAASAPQNHNPVLIECIVAPENLDLHYWVLKDGMVAYKGQRPSTDQELSSELRNVASVRLTPEVPDLTVGSLCAAVDRIVAAHRATSPDRQLIIKIYLPLLRKYGPTQRTGSRQESSRKEEAM